MQQDQQQLFEQPQTGLQAEPSLDLFEYLRVLLKFKWGIIGLAVLLGLVGYYVALKSEPVFRSTTKLQIERPSGAVSLGNLLMQPTMGTEFYSTQYEMIKSWGVAEMAAIRLDLLDENGQVKEGAGSKAGRSGFSFKSYMAKLLNTPVPVLTDAQRRDNIILGIQRRTQVSPIKNSELVNISFEDPDPEFAARQANTVAEAYIEFLKTKHLEDITGNQTWYTSRLEQSRVDMETAEKALQDYNERFSLLLSSAGEGSEQSQRYRDAEQARAQAQARKLQLQDIYQQVSNVRSESAAWMEDIAALNTREEVAPLHKAFLDAGRRVTELSQRYGPKHPRMIDAQAVLETSRRFYHEALEQAADSIVASYRAAQSEETQQTERFRRAEADLLALSRSQADKVKLESDVEQTRKLYEQMRSGVRSADMMGAGIQKVNAMIIERARTGLSPVRPDKPRMIMMWALTGLALGVGVAFFLNYLDNTFRHSGEVERRLALPVLGMLPKLQLAKKDADQSLGPFAKAEQPAYLEAIRTIRTSVILSCLEQTSSCLVVTSSLPNEGKTSLAMNLAHSIANMRSTLLIDLDLRRPGLEIAEGIDGSRPGITEWLTGEAEMRDVLVSATEGELHVIPSGSLSARAPDILSSRRLKTLIAELKKQYEFIIIDSPPVLAVSDAVIVSQLADAVLYVVQTEVTPRKAAEQGIKYLRRTEAPLLGVVMNQVTTQDFHYGYRKQQRYYRYGYDTDRVPNYYGEETKT